MKLRAVFLGRPIRQGYVLSQWAFGQQVYLRMLGVSGHQQRLHSQSMVALIHKLLRKKLNIQLETIKSCLLQDQIVNIKLLLLFRHPIGYLDSFFSIYIYLSLYTFIYREIKRESVLRGCLVVSQSSFRGLSFNGSKNSEPLSDKKMLHG